MIGKLKGHILDRWDEILPETKKPRDLSFLVTGSPFFRVPYTKAIIIFFVPGSSRPVLFGKVADDPRYSGMVEDEYGHLKRMHDGPYPDAVKSAVPRPIGLQKIGRDTVMIETAVTGKSMFVDMVRHSKDPQYMRAIFDSGLAWLVQIRNDEISHSEEALAVAVEFIEETVLGFYDELYSPTGDEKAALEDAWALVKPLLAKELPLVPTQGDYWINNMFWADKKVTGVVDWEFARAVSLPMWDLFQLQFSMGIEGNKHPTLRAMFDAAFFKDSSITKYFRECLPRYCDVYGISFNPQLVESLFVLWLAQTSARERRLIGKSFEADALRREDVLVYLDRRKPNWSTFG